MKQTVQRQSEMGTKGATVCYYRTSLETELQRYSKLRVEDIATIQQWIVTQPHLPPVFDVQIAHFLHACYYDVEVAKSTIENYFTYKTTMVEFFKDWDPKIKTTFDYGRQVVSAAFLPKQSDSDCRILLARLRDSSAELYNFDLGVRWILISISSLLFQDGQQEEFKIVYDCTHYSFSHAIKNPLASFKHYLDFGQKASAIRVVEIHFINSGSVIKNIVALAKPFMNKQVSQMLNFHTSPQGFFQSVPKEVTPSDYGGTGPSVETLNEKNIQRVEEMGDALIAHSTQKTDESKRLGKKKKTKETEEFKKLEVD